MDELSSLSGKLPWHELGRKIGKKTADVDSEAECPESGVSSTYWDAALVFVHFRGEERDA